MTSELLGLVFFLCGTLLFCCRPTKADGLAHGLLELDVTLAPRKPYHIRVGIGQAKFLKVSCMGGPADVMVSLSTYAQRADPLLFLSVNPDKPPSFTRHDASSYLNWEEDKSGDHYAVAQGLGPRGGILGLVNLRHFAGEELDGVLSVHCHFIVAFDTLFWDHLRSSLLCPTGGGTQMCSGRGRCAQHGICTCDAGFAGPACEHHKTDLVVKAEGHYQFRVAAGKYQYFRVHVPRRFPGGFLQVHTEADQPMVVLVREGGPPTKGTFEMSNFDDWLNRRSMSTLKYKVHASDTFVGLFGGAPSLPQPPMGRRRLDTSAGTIHCPPAIAPEGRNLACETASMRQCTNSCMRCIGCNRTVADDACSKACDACSSLGCTEVLALCASDESCSGERASTCDSGCGRCLRCLRSDDVACSQCSCCDRCLPEAAKCGALSAPFAAEDDRYIFVAVYNHHRYTAKSKPATARVFVSLREDPDYERKELPKSWLADLYNPFHSIGSLEITQRDIYPDGEQFIYNLEFTSNKELNLEARVYRDRITLLHLINKVGARSMVLNLTGGPSVAPILSSTKAAPKTLFDFNQVHTKAGGVQIFADREPSLWCAIFGANDGFVRIAARTDPELAAKEALLSAAPSAWLVNITAIGCCGLLAIVVGLLFARGAWSRGAGSRMGFAHSVPHRNLTGHSSNNSAEDEYLYRGGFGDDGM